MFPNSPNTHLTLLCIYSKTDSIGKKEFFIKGSRNIVGIKRSITSQEYQTSTQIGIKYEIKVLINSFLYDDSKYAKVDGTLYKIERTYLNGQFLELYLVKSDIEVKDE